MTDCNEQGSSATFREHMIPASDIDTSIWMGFGGTSSSRGNTVFPYRKSGAAHRTSSTSLDIADEQEVALDRSSGRPLHEQLAEVLQERIRSHMWEAGMRIPSEHELSQRFGLARGTVRRAISILVDEGMLVQERGKGTFVSDPGIWHTSGRRLLSFAASLHEQGKEFVTHVLDERVLPASEAVARELDIAPGSPALFLRRVRDVGGESVVCQESWLSMDACPDIENADFLHESAFDAVERCSGKHIADSCMRYTARAAGKEHAAYLRCDAHDPMLVLEQLISLEDGTPIEWSLTWLRDNLSILGSSVQDCRLGAALVSTDVTINHQDIPESKTGRLSRRELELRALDIRRKAVGFALDDPAHPYHLGGSLSAAEIFAVLLNEVMHTGKDGTPWDNRDRLVLSKAHAALALYPALEQAGYVSEEDMSRGLYGSEAVLFKHPRRDLCRGIELSGGSLGLGPAHACGLVMANRRFCRTGRVFCILGDGECNEGSVWESVAFAGHNRLGELTFIVDVNGLQLDGPTADILGPTPDGTSSLAKTFASFGWDVIEVDGHDVIALRDALIPTPFSPAHTAPRVVLAHTVKGKGLSFMEDRVEWHDNLMTEEERMRVAMEFDARKEAILHE